MAISYGQKSVTDMVTVVEEILDMLEPILRAICIAVVREEVLITAWNRILGPKNLKMQGQTLKVRRSHQCFLNIMVWVEKQSIALRNHFSSKPVPTAP